MHTLGALYESMLREMPDAAGDSGKFYTPGVVVRLRACLKSPWSREELGLEFRVYAARWLHTAGTA